MSYRIKYKPLKRCKKDWAIFDERGHIVGRSTSKEKAGRSVGARLAGAHGWRPK